MRKKLFTTAVAFVLSALTSNAFAFPTWLELRNEIINYYKTIDTSKQWCIDSDGDLEITYTSSSGSERKAYIMMIESEQAIPDMPPAVCYFESTTPAKTNAKKMTKCADAINWALPGVGQVYYKNDAICVASSIYAYSAPYVAMQITQLGTFSSMAIDLAEKCTDYVTDSFFQNFAAPGFKDFGNRVVKQLNDMGFLSAKEVSNDVVEYTLGDTNIRISPQGYSLGSNQFIMVGTSFSACDFGVKPEKAKKIVAEQFLSLSCQTSRIVVSEDDGTVMVISMMPAEDQSLEEDLKRGLAAYSVDVAVTALTVKNAFKGK